jgi:signal transduction histidine kinase
MALTAGMFCALLLVLNVLVYEAAQVTLLQSLRQSVSSKTIAFAAVIENGTAVPKLRLALQSWPPRGEGALFSNTYMSLEIVDPHLAQAISIGASHQLPPLDPVRAARALQGSLASPYSTQQLDTDGPYLIYTARIGPGSGPARGVLQMAVSEQQYLSSLASLRAILTGVSVLGLLAAAALSGLLARYAVGPIRAALRRQREFVADAAHELRTPLAIMRTASEMGLTGESQADQTVALEQTMHQIVHLTQMVTSLSLLARADSGVVPMERVPFDLADLAGETMKSITFLAEYQEVTLHLDAPAPVPVLGDAGRLRQLLLIVLDNALKHTPRRGAITVHAGRAGGRAVIEVRDSGAGIAPEDLPHLFDRFYRAARDRSVEGTGLGLAIARWIAQAHGGRIVAANAPEGGAVFTLMLPLAA